LDVADIRHLYEQAVRQLAFERQVVVVDYRRLQVGVDGADIAEDAAGRGRAAGRILQIAALIRDRAGIRRQRGLREDQVALDAVVIHAEAAAEGRPGIAEHIVREAEARHEEVADRVQAARRDRRNRRERRRV